MTATNDFDRLVSSWLAGQGTPGLSPAAFDAALDTAGRTRQRRGLTAVLLGPAPWPRRGRVRAWPVASPRTRLALAGALLLLLSAAAAFVGARLLESEPLDPGGYRGQWVAANPGIDEINVDGPAVWITFDGTGRRFWLLSQPGSDFGVARMASGVETAEPGELRLVATRDGHGCLQGDEGWYRWTLQEDGLILRMTRISDDCGARGRALERDWTRSHSGVSFGGPGVADHFDPLIQLALTAESWRGFAPVPGVAEMVGGTEEEGDPLVVLIRDPVAFADPCDIGAGTVPLPTRAAFLDFFERSPAHVVASPVETTVDGLPATHLLLGMNPDYPCPTGVVLEFTSADSPDFEYHIEPGLRDSLYVIEVDGRVVLLALWPSPVEAEDAIVGSVRFLDGLPSEP